jgi:hypothetical protein
MKNLEFNRYFDMKRIFKLISIFILLPTAMVGMVGGEVVMKGEKKSVTNKFDNAEAIRRIELGDLSASDFIKPGDSTVLPKLKNLLNSESLDFKESAINALIATRLAEAVTILVNYCEREKNDQLVWAALNGFLLFHPKSAKDDLVRLAQSRRIAQSEFPEMAQSLIIRVIGLMGNPAFITDIQALDKNLPKSSVSDENFQDTREFAVLMACSRLGDLRSADKLIKKLHEIPLDDLLNCLKEVPYVQSRVVARGLLSFLDDQRQGTALFSFNRRIGASAPKDSKATKKSDGTPFGTVKDDAVVAILRMLPDEPWGVELDPHRRYSDQEVKKIKDHLLGMKLE